jgi:hypothetical protein
MCVAIQSFPLFRCKRILFAPLIPFHFIASWHHERVETRRIAYVRGGNKIIEAKKTGNHKKVMEKTQEKQKREKWLTERIAGHIVRSQGLIERAAASGSSLVRYGAVVAAV